MNEKIVSKQNQYVKLVRELRTKKGRSDYKKVVIEGKKFVSDCIKLGVKFDFILYTEEQQEFVNTLDITSYEVSPQIMKELSSFVTPQGILAVVASPEFTDSKPTTNFIVLDGLQDAGNLGTILRTALATGFLRVIMLDCVDVFSEKVINSSMTAVFNLELLKCKREEFAELIKTWDLPLYIADLDGVNALQLDANYDIIGVVIGNEGNGVSREISALATQTITLPMDSRIESLNAGVSAGVLMYVVKYRLKGE